MRRFSLLLLLAISINLFGKLVIFDFGGVLATKSRFTAANKLEMGSMLKFVFSDPSVFIGIQAKLYKYLSQVPASSRANAIQNSELYSDDSDGVKLPPILVDWLLGNVSGKEIIQKLEKVEFEKSSDKTVMLKASGVFLPENLSEIMKLNTAMFNLVKECKARGHRVVLLSNFDSETFKKFKEMYPDEFSFFDAIYISGDLNQVKPCEEIFKTVLEKENVRCEDIIFVDDSKNNVEAAKRLKIQTIYHTSVAKTTRVLKKLLKAQLS